MPPIDLLVWFALFVLVITIAVHAFSMLVTMYRCLRARRADRFHPEGEGPPVTVIRPVCGIDYCAEETLKSTFDLQYENYEIIFCVASRLDPVVPIVERLIGQHPSSRAQLLVGDDAVSSNPKLNNVVKGWKAARHDLIAIVDSNVVLPRDYIQRLLEAWQDDTGLVSSPAVGDRPTNFWAELECAFLNAYQARWQLFGDFVGNGFAQGKNLFWHRSYLERGGGIAALGNEIAEDVASTKVVRSQGLRVRLVDSPFPQPLGFRSARDVWNRQARWARVRRSGFPRLFLSEVATGAVPPMASLAVLATMWNWPLSVSLLGFCALWYGSEMSMARLAGWHVTPLYPVYGATRDLLIPFLWLDGLCRTDFVWRGNIVSGTYSVEQYEREQDSIKT